MISCLFWGAYTPQLVLDCIDDVIAAAALAHGALGVADDLPDDDQVEGVIYIYIYKFFRFLVLFLILFLHTQVSLMKSLFSPGGYFPSFHPSVVTSCFGHVLPTVVFHLAVALVDEARLQSFEPAPLDLFARGVLCLQLVRNV